MRIELGSVSFLADVNTMTREMSSDRSDDPLLNDVDVAVVLLLLLLLDDLLFRCFSICEQINRGNACQSTL